MDVRLDAEVGKVWVLRKLKTVQDNLALELWHSSSPPSGSFNQSCSLVEPLIKGWFYFPGGLSSHYLLQNLIKVKYMIEWPES